ncbi:MAG TPA: SAM-dependent methyltransferase [Thermoanaerobaculia bacterium]|jgi:methyltransferase (TIGR00027 family)|nr:SAM-dependent methyltransferase [Thermoanaerobaculia bacterium]
MSPTEPTIRNVSDTARWAAFFRAQESERKDALFRDPFAARLAGDRGAAAARSMSSNDWAWVTRTYVFDDIIGRCIAEGADTVVNLAAGMDARPYRMDLPASLRWFEVDLPEILTEKEQLLAGETPRCQLERVKLDLADVEARRALFGRIGSQARRALVVSEGLIIYLTREQVAELARDLASPPSFQDWAMDVVSPGLLEMLQKKLATEAHIAAPLQFAPAEGPPFFEPFGWKPAEVHSLFKTAVRKGRIGFPMRLFAIFPESTGRQGKRPWGGVCRLQRA